ncbi:MAG: hypothetical protein ISS16_11285 [Ignavibacteria bacterium]|nr:hypothetical protein [Ignavibacteria bacterium]
MKKIFPVIILLFLFGNLYSQELKENKTKKWVTWSLLQLIPSPTFFQDSDKDNARIQFGFKWNITPINISFNPNKYVSPVQFVMIDPVRRFTGSAEIFVQPELATASLDYSNASVFGISTGPRIILPIYEKGESLSFSIGGKFTYRKNFSEGKNHYYGVEAGLYVFGGMLGLQYTQNFETSTKYNFNIYIKYF